MIILICFSQKLFEKHIIMIKNAGITILESSEI